MNAPFDPSDHVPGEPDGDDGEGQSEPENLLDRIQIRKPRQPRQPRQPKPKPDAAPFQSAPPGADQHFRALGYNYGRSYFFTAAGKQIISLSNSQLGKKAELMALAPLDWWEREFATDNGFSGRAVDMATNYLIQACYRKGVFTPDQRRGRGVWRDFDNIVIHAGDRLYVDGVEVSLVAAQTEAVYECQERISIGMDSPLSRAEAARVMAWAQSLNWIEPTHAVLLVGWIVVAIASGALTWRPHVFLNGPKGCGKSSILDVILHLMGRFAISATGGTSAAGLRQSLQSDALPVIFDEAEGDTLKSASNIDEVLSLMRHASASLEAKVIKGGADGRASATLVRSCFCLSAIRDPLTQAADQSRVSVLSLAPASAASRLADQTVTKPLADQICSDDFAHRFRGLVFARVPTLLEVVQVFSTAAGELFAESRMGDQIGALMGGAWLVMRDGVPTLDEARAMLTAQSWGEQRELIAESSDEDACLRAILEAHIKVDGEGWHGDASIGELIEFVRSGINAPGGIRKSEAERALAMYGLRVDCGRGEGVPVRLAVSNANGMLARKVMAHTAWPKGWGKLLARLPGAEKPSGPIYLGGQMTRAVWVLLPAAAGNRSGP